jgi:hypothetical protein
MMRLMRSISWLGGIAGFVLPGVLAAQQPAPAAAGQTTPCELVPQATTRLNSDSIPNVGRVVFVGGGVLIKCPKRGITLKGDSAQQYPDHDQMIGNAVYDEPRVHVTGDYLTYFPVDERIVGVGNVHGRLPSGSTLDGPQAEIKRAIPKIRPRRQVTAMARPTINIITTDSTGKAAPPMTVIANTVYMDGDSLIYGGGQVEITRPELRASGDSAFIDQGKETMRLMRNPKLEGKKEKPFTLTGDLIDMYSKDRKLQRVLSQGNANALSDSMTLKSDTIDLRVQNDLLSHAFAWGSQRAHVLSPSQNMIADSLDVTMPGQRIQLVRALRTARAEGKPDTLRFKAQGPDSLNWLRGDTIVAHFDSLAANDTTKTPPIRQLVASGHASSLYLMPPNDTSVHLPALNYVTARIITIDIDNTQKLSTVTTVDSVSGVYIEPKPDSTARKRTNATTQNGKTPPGKTPPGKTPPQTPAKPPTSVIPVPTKPPTSP